MQNYIGKGHADLLNWLLNSWLTAGPPVCLLEGFSGVGKTSLARVLMAQTSKETTAIMVSLPESGLSAVDDLLLGMATELSIAGHKEMADAVSRGAPLALALDECLRSKVLIVIDEAQRAFAPGSGRPISSLEEILQRFANRPTLPGRVFLLSNQLVDRGRWLESCEIRTLGRLEPEEAERLLDSLLASVNRSNEVPADRRRDVVNWLGCNPRALRVLVAGLERDSLDDLIGLNPESWELKDRDISPELISKLERELLARTLSHLNSETFLFLCQLSVHRKSIRREALKALIPGDAALEPLRDGLISRFLLEQHRGWFSLNPLAREIALQKLKGQAAEFRQAHSRAADYYTRHFTAKTIVGSGELGGYFVEARYHLVQAKREADLASIAKLFEQHLKSTISEGSPIPKSQSELNERIAVLSALLESPGPKGLEYHLARLLMARGSEDDLQLALVHARRAIGTTNPSPWVFLIELEDQLFGTDQALQTTRDGIARIPADKNLFSLYQSGGELLAKAGRTDEAIALLKEGIARISADQSLFSLYQSGGKVLTKAGRTDEAIALLEEGMRMIPAGKWGQHRIVEQILFLYASIQDMSRLEDTLKSGKQSIAPLQLIIGEILLLQMQQNWEQAAGVAKHAHLEFPTSIAFVVQEAFSRLCVGDAQAAEGVFQKTPISVKVAQSDAITWLRVFIHLRLADREAAREMLSAYLGRAVQEEELSEDFLLKLWDESVDPSQDSNIAYTFPILPPSLTGLNAPVVRAPYGPPIFSKAISETGARLSRSEKKIILAVATEWQSRHGGLSTFNRELCLAMGRAGYQVFCLLPEATVAEIEAARSGGVELVVAPNLPGSDAPSRLFMRPQLPPGVMPDIIIGHDRITGPAANALKTYYFQSSLRIQFIHTAPGEIEWFKPHLSGPGAAVTAEERERLQIDLAVKADLIVAVGPRLYREFATLMIAPCPPIIQFNPGLSESHAARRVPPGIQCLLLGRAEDGELKGVDIAARAMGLLPHPSSGSFNSEPTLIVRGASSGTADRLQKDLLRLSNRPGLKLRVKEYTERAEYITEDLLRSSILLMPSRSEGFGLVGLEAISAGTPVLVSDQSGLGELLQHELPEMARNCVVPVTTELATDAPRWSKAIEFVLRDREAAFNRAMALRQQLEPLLSWQHAADVLSEAIGQIGAAPTTRFAE